jgi:IS5 family transposase
MSGRQAVTVSILLRHSLQAYTRMPIKTSTPPSCASYCVEKRKTKRVFLKQIAQRIHWERGRYLLNQINSQLTGHGVLVKQGAAIVDASVTPTLRKPKGKSSYTLAEGKEPPLDKTWQPGVDREARWVKKGDKLQYGYKRHYLDEAQEGLVIAVHTTPANVHDSQLLGDCLNKVKLPPRSRVLADKGYCSQANEALLHSKGLRSGIQRKAYRSMPLTRWAKRYK